MLHFNAAVDEGRQGDKACFKSIACQAHQAERKTSVFSVLSVAKKSTRFQSKTLTPKNKNQIFQNFLSPSKTKSYGPRAPENEQIFGSKLHTRLIIEGLFFPSLRQYEI
jgi:hypothetical protein